MTSLDIYSLSVAVSETLLRLKMQFPSKRFILTENEANFFAITYVVNA